MTPWDGSPNFKALSVGDAVLAQGDWDGVSRYRLTALEASSADPGDRLLEIDLGGPVFAIRFTEWTMEAMSRQIKEYLEIRI